MKIRVLSGILMVAALVAPVLAQVPPSLSSGSADYQVGSNDVFEVTVFGEAELSRTVQVAEDGSISLGLLDAVFVEGLTSKQIEGKLETLYKEYLKAPKVFVTIKEYKSQVIQVFGGVRTPGQHRLTGPSKVLDILSGAGGTSEAGGEKALLLKKQKDKDGSPVFESIEIDLHKLLAEGDSKQNLEVKGGDVLYVPRADEIYVLGEVKNPGAVKFEAGITLTQAISKVAGFTRTASRRVQVVRVEADKKIQRDYNVGRIENGKDKDPILQARDLVVVPESIF
jgi:polysaccharide biosynthesis/export protein